MQIQTICVKQINLNDEGLHVLCIPHGDNFYRIQFHHDKYAAVLTFFGGNYVKADDDESLVGLALFGAEEYHKKYVAMCEREEKRR